jgi:hypothetical protein
MHPAFSQLIEGLHCKCEKLLAMPPCRAGELPIGMPKQGVYLFTEGGVHLYVGRSNKIRARYGRHCNPGATHRMAAFGAGADMLSNVCDRTSGITDLELSQNADTEPRVCASPGDDSSRPAESN